MGDWLTTKVVSRELGVSEHSLRSWLRQGLVPGAGKLPSGEWRLPADAEQQLVRLTAEEQASDG
jgi:predicted site-specific integrase-resolvase